MNEKQIGLFDEADRKISLSMKALEADNAQEQTEE